MISSYIEWYDEKNKATNYEALSFPENKFLWHCFFRSNKSFFIQTRAGESLQCIDLLYQQNFSMPKLEEIITMVQQ